MNNIDKVQDLLNKAEEYRKRLNEPPIDTKLSKEVDGELEKAFRLFFNIATKEEKEEEQKNRKIL